MPRYKINKAFMNKVRPVAKVRNSTCTMFSIMNYYELII